MSDRSISEPIVFVSHFRVKEDRSDNMPDLSNQIATAMEAGKPRTLGFLFYLNEDRSQMSIALAGLAWIVLTLLG